MMTKAEKTQFEQSKKAAKLAVALYCAAEEVGQKLNGFLPIIEIKDKDVAEAIQNEIGNLNGALAEFSAQMKKVEVAAVVRSDD